MSSSGPFHRFLNGESDRRTRNGRYPIDIPPYTNQSNGSADAAAGHGVSAAVARNGRNNTGVQTTVASSNAGNVAAASTSSNHHTTSSRNPSHSTSTNTRRRPAQQQTGGANRSASASNNGQGAESELSGNDDPSEGSAKNATRKRKRATASSNPGPRGRNTKKAKEDKTKGSQETVKVKPFATTTYLDTHRLEPLSRFPRYFRLGTEPDTSAQISMPTTVHDREAATWQGRIAPHLPPLQKYSEIQGNIKEIDDAIRKGLDRDQVDDDEEDIEVPKRGVRGRKDRLYAYNGLDETLPPLPTLPDIFADLSRKALDLGLREILEKSPSIVLKIATLCSGTEAPLLALQMIRDYLRPEGHNFGIDPQFSCEIEPYKQAYIQRNFDPKLLFRDVMDLKNDKARTAFGGEETVPSHADIMVAGSSCIDYSSMNSHRKAFGESGESNDTKNASLAYAKKHKPSIVILENVVRFPWPKVEKEYRDAGYATKVVLLDSKDHGLPQTRRRGYMIGIRREAITERILDLDPDLAVKRWAELLGAMQRRASSPFTDFIFADDDPELQKYLAEAAQLPNTGKIITWDKCRAECLNYRAAHLLGFQRPFTEWQNNGSCNVPDFCNSVWFPQQVERIWDTVEINHLRSIVHRYYDMSFKSRPLDMSQSCNYEKDNCAPGVVRCITPTAEIYLTDRGGPLVGAEVLALQGLPREKLILNRESSKQLIDLSGNAMSTPVVGAAMLSALISSFPLFVQQDKAQTETLNPSMTNSEPESLDENIPEGLCERDLSTDLRSAIDIKKLREMALLTSRLCLCESLALKLDQTFQQCSKCGHTSCMTCGRKPKHHYKPIAQPDLQPRIPAVDFEEWIRKMFPVRLVTYHLQHALLTAASKHSARFGNDYTKAVEQAITKECRLVSIKRGRGWRVIYESECSILVLTCRRKWKGHVLCKETVDDASSAIRVQWEFFAKPGRELAVDSPIRKDLTHPIARLICSDSLFDGQWEIRVPPGKPFTLEVVGSGERIPSWEKKQGLEDPQFKNRFVWSRLEFRAPASNGQSSTTISQHILGVYELLEDCGAASGTLHRKVETLTSSDQEPVFLFLDPVPFGNASMDSFVFGNEHERIGRKEAREISAKIDPRWRHSVVSNVPTLVQCEAPLLWLRVEGGRLEEPSAQDLKKVYLAPVEAMSRAIDTPCRTSGLPVIFVRFPIAKDLEQKLDLKTPKSFKLVKDPFSLESLSWLLKKIGSDLQYREWQKVPSTVGLEDRCLTCAPRLPDVVWKAVTVRGVDEIRPYENIKEASDYERRVKQAPEEVLASVSYDRSSEMATLQVKFNLMTMFHKVFAARPESRPGLLLDWTLDWRVVPDHGHDYPVSPLNIELRHCQDHPRAPRPPNFRHNLTEPQSKSLDWMLGQEKDTNKSWVEEEVMEARVSGMAVRVETRITAPNPVLGGVLADDVGYGKTALILALIDHDLHSTAPVSLPLKEGVDDMIDLKATLVLTPPNLSTQWKTEIENFLGTTYHVLDLNTTNLATMSTIEELREADIILASWDVFNESYFSHLANMSKAPHTPFSDGRGFEQWFQMAQKDLRTLVMRSNGLQQELFDTAWQTLQMNKYDKFIGLSKRNKKGYQEPMDTQSDDSSSKAKSRLLDVDEINIKQPKGKKRNFVPLHACKFRRLVVDEYTYLGGKEKSVVEALQALRRWILSGTPKYDDFNSVNKMAQFLGTRLGRPDETDLRNQKTRVGKPINNSSAEVVRSYVTTYTSSWHQARNDRAELFADQYVRKNTAMVEGVEKTDHYVNVALAAPERIFYHEVQLLTANQGVKTGKKGSLASPPDNTLGFIARSPNPEGALVIAANTIVRFTNKLSSDPPSAGTLQEKGELIIEKVKAIYPELQAAFFLLRAFGDPIVDVPHVHQLFRSLQQNHFGDATVFELLDRVFGTARANPNWTVAAWIENDAKKAGYETRVKEDSSEVRNKITLAGRKQDLKLRTETLTQWVVDLTDLVREYRFLAAADACLSGQSVQCTHCGNTTGDYAAMVLMGRCGHVACKQCYMSPDRQGKGDDQCPHLLCRTQAAESAVIGLADLAVALPPGRAQQGSKMTALATLLGSIPPAQKVVVFAQFGAILSAVRAALHHSKIPFADTTAIKSAAAAAMKEFNNNKQRVCLLELDSSNAAGWNLQSANHVVFVCPLLTNSQHSYDAAMTQAVGRVWRLGQGRDVHVYHMVVEKTIEVNVLEGRTGKVVVERGGSVVLVEEEGVVDGDRALVGPPFLGEACGTGGGRF